MSHVTTHVLDAACGRPAVGVAVELLSTDGSYIASGVTDDDGRIGDLGPDLLESGSYRLVFDTGSYFASSVTETFYPRVTIDFTVTPGVEAPGPKTAAHLHVPLLLSPFAYSTYRGS